MVQLPSSAFMYHRKRLLTPARTWSVLGSSICWLTASWNVYSGFFRLASRFLLACSGTKMTAAGLRGAALVIISHVCHWVPIIHIIGCLDQWAWSRLVSSFFRNRGRNRASWRYSAYVWFGDSRNSNARLKNCKTEIDGSTLVGYWSKNLDLSKQCTLVSIAVHGRN
jgi:hypothetical protein